MKKNLEICTVNLQIISELELTMRFDSLERLTEIRPEIKKKMRGLPHTGCRPDGKNFSTCVSKIDKAFKVYGTQIFKVEPHNTDLKKHNLGGGSPIPFRPFPLAVKEIKKCTKRCDLYEYPLAAGDPIYKKSILEYLKNEGFYNYENNLAQPISNDNIIFTMSTTQAFDLIIKTICKPYDVVIMTGPNYGLFTYLPERHNVGVVILDLKEEDNYFPNAKRLKTLIEKTNNQLKKRHKGLGYVPRVVAFFNENPHNPMGFSMGKDNISLLQEIGEVCCGLGVFVIDDLLYRDICFDPKDLAIPIATIKGMFKNTISLLGLSKSYNLASARAGLVVADEIIIRGIRNCIFQEMDSTSIIQQAALAGAFNTSLKRKKLYVSYFNKLRNKYKYSFEILKFMVKGKDNYFNNKYKNKIIRDISAVIKDKNDKMLVYDGMQDVKLINEDNIKAGFFALLEMTKLMGKRCDDFVVNDDKSLLMYFYKYGFIKYLMGTSISWPNEQQVVARVTFAKDPQILIEDFCAFNKCIRMLK